MSMVWLSLELGVGVGVGGLISNVIDSQTPLLQNFHVSLGMTVGGWRWWLSWFKRHFAADWAFPLAPPAVQSHSGPGVGQWPCSDSFLCPVWPWPPACPRIFPLSCREKEGDVWAPCLLFGVSSDGFNHSWVPPSTPPARCLSLCSHRLSLGNTATSHCSLHGIPPSASAATPVLFVRLDHRFVRLLCTSLLLGVCVCVWESKRLKCIFTLLVCESQVQVKVCQSPWWSHPEGCEMWPTVFWVSVGQFLSSAAPRNGWVMEPAESNSWILRAKQGGKRYHFTVFGLTHTGMEPTASQSHRGEQSITRPLS